MPLPLSSRASGSALVQEGEEATDSARDLLSEIEALNKQTQQLVQRINRTNSAIRLSTGQTLSDAIVERDHCAKLREPFSAVARAASYNQSRYSHLEIRN
jgi:hypothetical protein